MFMCVATGDPMPSITWFKDGVELDNNVNTYIHVSFCTGGIFLHNPFHKMNSLTFALVKIFSFFNTDHGMEDWTRKRGQN